MTDPRDDIDSHPPRLKITSPLFSLSIVGNPTYSCEPNEPCTRWTDGDQDRTNPFAAVKGKKSAMRPFAKLLKTLVIITKIQTCHVRQITHYFRAISNKYKIMHLASVERHVQTL